ncbi:MAG: glycosyltransferase, partial [Acidobacteriota bacterium]
ASGPLLVTVGTLSERKGQDLVIQALPEIRRQIPEVRYAAIGMDHASGALTALARAVGVEDLVHFPGRLSAEEVRAFLGTADLFVLPSRRTAGGDVEGFGIAVVEAALCGTPAVVSSGSGLVEAIRDGETGLAVEPESPAALARAITELLSDDARRRAMASRAQERARSEQTWERRGGQYFRALEELVGG